MNCANHPDIAAAAFCRSCGKPVCETCKRPAQGTIYCEEHVPAPAPSVSTPGVAAPVVPAHTVAGPVDLSASPGLAFALGFIPGVGAIYNGQYSKGLVHAVIFGLLVSIVSSNYAGGLEPLFGILIACWEFYMAMEAYHTARKRRAGEQVDEFSSLLDLQGRGSRVPMGAVLLILLGVLLLLNTTDIIPLQRVLRYWPVLLIVFGVYLLFLRLMGGGRHAGGAAETNPEVRHDQ
jgi:hypothetical protein